MRKSFVFYLSWKELIKSLNDDELRRFINNLISWHQDEEINLTTSSESAIWSLIEPALLSNDKKWKSRSETSRENGKLGGRPSKPKITQEFIEEPIEPVNSKELSVNGKLSIVDSEKLTDNCELEIEKSNIVNTGISSGNYFKNKIEELTTKLEVNYPHYPFLISMANPSGIKEVKNHINNKEEFDSIIKILKELAESKKQYRGNYE